MSIVNAWNWEKKNHSVTLPSLFYTDPPSPCKRCALRPQWWRAPGWRVWLGMKNRQLKIHEKCFWLHLFWFMTFCLSSYLDIFLFSHPSSTFPLSPRWSFWGMVGLQPPSSLDSLLSWWGIICVTGPRKCLFHCLKWVLYFISTFFYKIAICSLSKRFLLCLSLHFELLI